MLTSPRARAACFLAALLALSAGCGSGRNATDPPDSASAPLAGAAAGLASPFDMLRSISTGPADNDRFRLGAACEAALPQSRVAAAGPGKGGGSVLTFSPVWDPPASGALSDSAYAVYRMANMTSYSGPDLVQLNWLTAPADYGNLYIGVSDFTKNAWNWKQPGVDNTTSYTDLSRFFAPTGDMLIVVLLLGTDGADLNWVLAGGGLQVSATLDSDLNGDPAQNLAPLSVNFDATGSSVTGAQIIGYDWDFDSNGTYEIEGDGTGLASHIYTDPGDYTATVHVVTDQGGAGTESISFTAVDPANQPPVAVLNLDVSSGAAPLTANLSSASTDDGQIVKHEWDINNDGEFEYETGSTPNLAHIFAQMGIQTVTLRITDNDFATDTDSQAVTVNTGWSTTTIASGISVPHDMAMAVSGPLGNWKPCVAYQDYSSSDLYFTRAASASGSAWSSPVEPVDNTLNTGYGLAMIAATGSGPLLAYGVYENGSNEYSLRIVRATDVTGASWNPPVTVEATRDIGSKSALAFVAGMPALWSIEQGDMQGANTPLFYLATAADGSAWNPPVKIADALPGVFLSGISAAVASGQPFLACSEISQSAAPFSVYSASASDGSAWNPAQNIGGGWTANASAAIIGGRPALGGGGSGTLASVYYLRANGTSADDWPPGPLEVAPAGDGGEACLALLASGPALAWINLERACVMFSSALDANGDAWGAPYEITPRSSANGQLRMVMANGQPVICYSHSFQQKLLCAWLTP